MHDIKHISGARLAMRAIWARIVKLLSPVSADENDRRKELILNIILSISIPFLAFADTLIAHNSRKMGIHYHGVPFWVGSCIVLIFVGLFAAVKRGHGRAVSYILVSIYALSALYSGWHWGASLPATLLTVALVCVISSILIGSSFGFIMSAALVIGLSMLAYHEIESLGAQPWKYEPVNFMDILIYATILLFISAVSWLSNREIQKSLNRARASERSLARERDSLEIKVVERTQALRESQVAQIATLSQSAEFGRMSQGLFHDLMTPLTSVALHMETLRDVDLPDIQNTRAYVEKAMRASERMSTFMNHIRRSIETRTIRPSAPVRETVDIGNELATAISLLAYKARRADVHIHQTTQASLFCESNPLYFLQIFMNLLTNAIDACDKNSGEKIISVEISKGENIRIMVTDNGAGIAASDLDNIFDDFYTTKSIGGGTGIGLATVKKIVEEELGGSIAVESFTSVTNIKSAAGGAGGKGTTFTIIFPATR